MAGLGALLAAGPAPGETITFNPGGPTQQDLQVTIIDDDTPEPDETITFQLEEGAGYTIGTPGPHTYTIPANDAPAAGFASATGNSPEPPGDTGSTVTNIPVRLAAPSQATVEVRYRAVPADTDAEAADYTLAPGTLSFPPGTVEQAVPLEIHADNRYEPGPIDRVALELYDPVHATLGQSTHIHQIDDEAADKPSATLVGEEPATVAEGDARQISIVLSNPSEVPLTVTIAEDADPADYTLEPER